MAVPVATRREMLHPEAVCAHCGTTDNLTIDHIKPLSDEGGDERSNLQVLCGPCNSRKGGKRPPWGAGMVMCLSCRRMINPKGSPRCWQHPETPATKLADLWGVSTQEATDRAIAAALREEQHRVGQQDDLAD